MYCVWNAPATCKRTHPRAGRRFGCELLECVKRAGGDDLTCTVAIGGDEPERFDAWR